MSIISNDQLTPRESILLDRDKEENRLAREHATRMKQLDIAQRKLELQLRQQDAIKSRKHQESMKELEYAIRFQESRWRSLLKIPLVIIKLPVYLILGIGASILLARGEELPDKLYEILKS